MTFESELIEAALGALVVARLSYKEKARAYMLEGRENDARLAYDKANAMAKAMSCLMEDR